MGLLFYIVWICCFCFELMLAAMSFVLQCSMGVEQDVMQWLYDAGGASRTSASPPFLQAMEDRRGEPWWNRRKRLPADAAST